MADEEKQKEDGPSESAVEPPAAAQVSRSQIRGAFVGGLVALILAVVARELGWIPGNVVRYTIWGAVVGSLFGSGDSLAQAGQRLTQRDERWLNILVALIGMAVLFAGIIALARALSRATGPLFNS
jgi:hypothetical protein